MYPKTIKLDDKKLLKLLQEKGELIKSGIEKSKNIEEVEEKMSILDKNIQEKESFVDITDLNEQAKAIASRVDECIKEMEAVKQKIYDRMIEETPKEQRDEYDQLSKAKEQLEIERNKIAIQAQKYTDKIIPLGRKLMKPFLEDEFDDYDTIKLVDGEIVCTIFNHLEDFKKNYKK